MWICCLKLPPGLAGPGVLEALACYLCGRGQRGHRDRPRAAHCEQSSTTTDNDAVVFNATDTTISFPYFCSVLFCSGNKKGRIVF